ncbi:hypothetical protein [Mycobacterium sp. ST-F2]|uniref:beta strand repeat-containing protein n=1 Tax=Mycobacterium sp. ST-F2 TaxID=1490484 RepID=UPI001150C39C|nr:hypothetical protein [Mycobacterium sp. ST-F2]
MFVGPYTGTIAVFNTATGQQVGAGFQGTNLNVVVAGNDAVVSTYRAVGSSPVPSWGGPSTVYNPQITFLNLATGQQSGETVEYASGHATSAATTLLSADGQLATVTTVFRYTTQNTTNPLYPYTWHSVTTFETFSTSSGTQVGNTLTSSGAAATATLLSTNGAYALVTTTDDDDQSVSTTFIYTSTGQTNNIYDGAVASSDRNHAIVISTDAGTSRVSILDLNGGQRLSYTQIPGTSASPRLSTDGTRALITTSDSGTGHATAFDLTTGVQLGTVAYQGGTQIQVTDNLTRAIVATPSTDDDTVHTTVIDLISGQQLGEITTSGNPQILRAANDTRAIFTDSAHTVVVDLTTGRQLGSIDATGGIVLNADGTRALLTTTDYEPETGQVTASKIVVVDITTGRQLGTYTYTETQSGITSVQFAPRGDRAAVVTNSTDNATGVSTVTVTVFNTATGAKVNSLSIDQATTELSGIEFTAGGSRALIRTQTRDADGFVDATQFTVINTSTQDSGSIDNSPGNLLTAVFNQLGAQITYVVDQVRARITAFVTQATNAALGALQGSSSQPGSTGPNSPEEEAWEAFTLATGWIPIVGTFENGFSLVVDTNDLINAKNDDDRWDEAGDIAGDIVGLVPIVGPVFKGAVKVATPAIKTIVKTVTRPIAEFLDGAGKVVDGFISKAAGDFVTNVVRPAVDAAVSFTNGVVTAAQNTYVAIQNGFIAAAEWIGSRFH